MVHPPGPENPKSDRTRPYSLAELEDLLLYFSTSINHFNTEEAIAWDVVKNCIARLNFSDCVIYFVDEDRKVLIQAAAHGPKNPRDFLIAKPLEIPIGKGICGTVARTGIPEVIGNTSLDPRYIVDDERRLSEITVPIKIDGQVIGLIDCEHPDENFFTEQHLRLLNAIASFYAVRISKLRAERREELERSKLVAAERGMAKMRLQILNTQLGPHFLFNALNAMQHFIVTEEKKPALNYLSLFSKLIRHYLSNIDKDSISVAEEIQTLKLYLDLQQLRYGSRFQYGLDVPSDHPDQARIPPFLVQSLVENFLEAMIFQNKGSSAISLSVDIRDEVVLFDLSIQALNASQFNDHLPEYRKGLAQWTDHIEVYNRIRKYNITYTVEDKWSGNVLIGKLVRLTMPNLT